MPRQWTKIKERKKGTPSHHEQEDLQTLRFACKYIIHFCGRGKTSVWAARSRERRQPLSTNILSRWNCERVSPWATAAARWDESVCSWLQTLHVWREVYTQKNEIKTKNEKKNSSLNLRSFYIVHYTCGLNKHGISWFFTLRFPIISTTRMYANGPMVSRIRSVLLYSNWIRTNADPFLDSTLAPAGKTAKFLRAGDECATGEFTVENEASCDSEKKLWHSRERERELFHIRVRSTKGILSRLSTFRFFQPFLSLWFMSNLCAKRRPVRYFAWTCNNCVAELV